MNYVMRSKSGIFISQYKYASEVLKIFNISNCKTSPTPAKTSLKMSKEDEGSTVDPMLFKMLVGSLVYLTVTRPDIMYGVSMISRLMESPKDSHWQAGKIISRYANGTIDLGYHMPHFAKIVLHYLRNIVLNFMLSGN